MNITALNILEAKQVPHIDWWQCGIARNARFDGKAHLIRSDPEINGLSPARRYGTPGTPWTAW